jgi:hypothetical protein
MMKESANFASWLAPLDRGEGDDDIRLERDVAELVPR